MTEAKGYICDRPECKKFEVSSALPPGWITLTIAVAVPKPQRSFGDDLVTKPAGNGNHFDLCSNACLAALALERAKAAGEPTPGIYVRAATERKPRSDAGKKRGAA